MMYPPSYTCNRQTDEHGEARGVHDYIKERTLKIGEYIVETKNTVRTIAREFGVSKSTVHKDLTERLPEINPDLANRVKEILEYHKSIRHLRGGEATKKKYRKDETKRKMTKNLQVERGVSSPL
jgi:putative DeoR family transcriptional regulator (stage III sporulation protein D)